MQHQRHYAPGINFRSCTSEDLVCLVAMLIQMTGSSTQHIAILCFDPAWDEKRKAPPPSTTASIQGTLLIPYQEAWHRCTPAEAQLHRCSKYVCKLDATAHMFCSHQQKLELCTDVPRVLARYERHHSRYGTTFGHFRTFHHNLPVATSPRVVTLEEACSVKAVHHCLRPKRFVESQCCIFCSHDGLKCATYSPFNPPALHSKGQTLKVSTSTRKQCR